VLTDGVGVKLTALSIDVGNRLVFEVLLQVAQPLSPIRAVSNGFMLDL
jgi:hypothetical protein